MALNLLSDIINYVRRIIKSPSDASISDELLIDYINRFWIMDVDARIQLFDLKTKYQFQTIPGVDQYNMPLYSTQSETLNPLQEISFLPVYQGFLAPAYINGVQVPFYTQKKDFFNIWPNVVQQMQVVAIGNGTDNYNITFPIGPQNSTPANAPYQYILRGHVDITGIIHTGSNTDPYYATTINTNIPTTSIFPAVYFTSMDSNGNSMVVSDSGQFLVESGNQPNYGLLMKPGLAPYGNTPLPDALSQGVPYSTTQNTVNYLTGTANVTFSSNVPAGVNINAQCFYFQSGLPRGILFNNNTLTLRSPPSQQFLVEIDAYLTPAAFLQDITNAIPFGYMTEYIARGAARKILSDTGDIDQFMFYEPLFKEQEMLVWKRAQRQFTSTRTQTLYSRGNPGEDTGWNGYGGSY